MIEYIEREAAIKSLPVAWNSAINALQNVPAADVVPAYRGYKSGMTRGECMRHARNRARVSIRQLSKLSGVPCGTISMLENNASRCGRIDTIELLADALRISIDEYVGHYRENDR